ncbi:hypothetical protein A9G38_00760 [Gilliamella sp. Imp1-1]|nr:hypothetical protein A9G38_00760 [Gilliamella apicola]
MFLCSIIICLYNLIILNEVDKVGHNRQKKSPKKEDKMESIILMIKITELQLIIAPTPYR